jgi:hypothetical protein
MRKGGGKKKRSIPLSLYKAMGGRSLTRKKKKPYSSLKPTDQFDYRLHMLFQLAY